MSAKRNIIALTDYTTKAKRYGLQMLAEFSLTRPQKSNLMKNCKNNKKCKAYVRKMLMEKEAYVTLQGLKLVK